MGKCVFISGASSGIGRATAIKFANEGYDLILNARREELLNRFIEEWGGKVNIRKAVFDVRDNDAAQEVLNGLAGDIDILINNAGLARGKDPIHEGALSDWNEMIDTNIKGLLHVTRIVSPHMVARKSGQIINVASTAGKEVYHDGNVYCASKHAVDALTKAMRLDLHKHGIRVGQVAPGHVEETEFARVRFHGDAEKAKIYEDFQPLKARDVADAIFFIASAPPHVNIQDILMMGTQQANSSNIHRSGR